MAFRSDLSALRQRTARRRPDISDDSMTALSLYHWDYDRRRPVVDPPFLRFSVANFQWQPKASGKGLEKVNASRVQGFGVEAAKVHAKVRAAELDISVSALVKDYLEKLAAEATDFEQRRRLRVETLATIRSFSAADRLPGEKVHQ